GVARPQFGKDIRIDPLGRGQEPPRRGANPGEDQGGAGELSKQAHGRCLAPLDAIALVARRAIAAQRADLRLKRVHIGWRRCDCRLHILEVLVFQSGEVCEVFPDFRRGSRITTLFGTWREEFFEIGGLGIGLQLLKRRQHRSGVERLLTLHDLGKAANDLATLLHKRLPVGNRIGRSRNAAQGKKRDGKDKRSHSETPWLRSWLEGGPVWVKHLPEKNIPEPSGKKRPRQCRGLGKISSWLSHNIRAHSPSLCGCRRRLRDISAARSDNRYNRNAPRHRHRGSASRREPADSRRSGSWKWQASRPGRKATPSRSRTAWCL